jgi:type IV pilus assembly protein PilE
MNTSRISRGFSLIELMIVVAIIAIIAAVVVPSYLDSVWKARRGEGKGALVKALQAEERFFSANNTYTAYAAGSAPNGTFPNFSGDTQANSRYNISVSAGPVANVMTPSGTTATLCPTGGLTACAVVRATVIGNADPNCGNALLMDTTGLKGVSATTFKDICWR